MKPFVTFADPEASAYSALVAGFAARSEVYKPATVSNRFPASALTGDMTHAQVELDGVPGGDGRSGYPVTERATLRVTVYSAPGKPSHAKDAASLAQAILYSFTGDADCFGFAPLTGRIKAVDPTTKNNMVSFTVRANMRPQAA